MVALTQLSVEVLNEKLGDGAWWVDVCAEIAGGKSHAEIAVRMCVKAALFRGWIGGDVEREREYPAALSYRQVCWVERAQMKRAGLVDAAYRDEDVNPGHVMKAIDSTLGAVDRGRGGGITVVVDRSCGGSVAIADGDGNRGLIGGWGGVSGGSRVLGTEASEEGLL